jgi:shikimate kinase
MRITITGPRSVGKSTISKIVAEKLNLKYISSDAIGEEALKDYGGLDKATKTGIIKEFIKKGGYNLIREVYQKEDNFVFDLSGGSISSRHFPEASKEVRAIANEKSIVFGLLPSKDINKSIKFLFDREKERVHFKSMDSSELLKKVDNHFRKFPLVLKEFCNYIIYTENKDPEKVADEMIKKLK